VPPFVSPSWFCFAFFDDRRLEPFRSVWRPVCLTEGREQTEGTTERRPAGASR